MALPNSNLCLKLKINIFTLTGMAQLVGHHQQSAKQKVTVHFLVRAHAWVVGLVSSWSVYERQLISVSPPYPCFSPTLLPSPLSKNK